MQVIVSNVMAYSPTMRSHNVSESGPSPRDEMQHFSEFVVDIGIPRRAKRVFDSPLPINHIGRKCFGTRAKDNAVQFISPRKANVQANAANCVADAFSGLLCT